MTAKYSFFFLAYFFFNIDINFDLQITGSKRNSIFEMHIGLNTNIGMHDTYRFGERDKLHVWEGCFGPEVLMLKTSG